MAKQSTSVLRAGNVKVRQFEQLDMGGRHNALLEDQLNGWFADNPEKEILEVRFVAQSAAKLLAFVFYRDVQQ